MLIDVTGDLWSLLLSGMVVFFATLLGMIGLIGYFHFKRVGQPDLVAALFRGLIAEILFITLFVVSFSDLYSFRFPDSYGMACLTVIGTVTAFNSVLFIPDR